MKNFFFIYLAIFSLSAILFTSCDPDPDGNDPDAPIITVAGDKTATVAAGTMAAFDITAALGKKDLVSVTVTVDGLNALTSDFSVNGMEAAGNPILLFAPETEDGFTYTMGFIAPSVGGTSFTYTVEVKDDKDLTNSVDITVTAELDNTPPTITTAGTGVMTTASSASFDVTGAVGGSDLVSLSFYKDGVLITDLSTIRIDEAGALTAVTANPLVLEGAAVNGFTVKYNLMAPEMEGGSFLYGLVLEDANGQQASADYGITKTISVQTEAFTFMRCGGGAGTGLDQYGLAWTSNTSQVAILKSGADKLVNLSGMTYDGLATSDMIKAAIDGASGIVDFREVSVDASDSYDLLIGTKVGSEYFLLNILEGTVEAGQSCGTRVTITGNAKY